MCLQLADGMQLTGDGMQLVKSKSPKDQKVVSATRGRYDFLNDKITNRY